MFNSIAGGIRMGLGMKLTVGILLRHKGVQFVASKYFMNDARAAWVAVEPEKKIGLKLFFPSVRSCQQCYNYLTGDANVTVVSSNPKGSKELVILPHQSPQETVEEILVDLYKNENSNYTLLRRAYERQKIIVEFGSPNIAKPLHMGHLRSAVTGNYVARIHKALGHEVSSFCFLGDWGTQFGLLHAGLTRWHEGSPLLENVNGMTLSELLEYYIRAVKEQETNPEFAAEARNYCGSLERGDSDAVGVWKAIRTKTVEHLDSVWKELDIRYDVMQGESDYTVRSGHTEKAMLLLEESEVIQTNPDGVKFALVTLGEKAKQKSKATLVKSDGSSLYILRDISAALHRKLEYQFDRMIYVVDRSQSHHFLALFDILRQMGVNESAPPESVSQSPNASPMFQHVSFGRVGGQSTRSGTFSLLSDVIRDGQDLMEISRASSPNTRYKDDVQIAKNLAISSLIVHSLKGKRNKDVEFDWTEALKSHGDTGVSLQYGHARLVSLIQKQGSQFIGKDGELKHNVDYEYILSDPVALNLMLRLVKIFRTDSTGQLSSGNSNGSHTHGSGGRGGGDKTVCEYCGVSYLTMSEMRALQTKVMDQEDRLNQLKDLVSENTRMKETLGSIRKTHRKEIQKRDEECQRWVIRCTNVENELDTLKRDYKKSTVKNADLAQKYAIASEDFKQQEELICQLRSKLQSEGDTEADNVLLKSKNKSLEENLQKLLQEIKSLRSTTSTPPPNSNTTNGRTHEGFSTTEIALKAKVAELSDRCNRLSAENNLYQEEIVSLLQNPPEKQAQPGLAVSSPREREPNPSNKLPSKMPSVVSVEVHDLKRENALLSSRLQSVSDEHSSCQDMHAFLRESIEKLKTDNVALLDELNGVKVKYEESLLKVENFQAVISGYQAERNRFMVSYKEQQNKLEQLAAQNRAFHKSCDPKMVETLRSQISTLERQMGAVEGEKDRLQLEFEGKVAQIQREVTMEKERADSCLTQSLAEREDVEKRWQERWSRHHNKLTDQLEILKTNYDGSLKCAKEREDALQREIHSLGDKLEKTGRAWDDYKVRMNEQLLQWKVKYEELEEELHNTVKCKVDVEVMFQEKTQQLEELHEAVRQGCEERQDLQRRTEELERSIQEAAFSCSTTSPTCLSYPPLDTLSNSMNSHCSPIAMSFPCVHGPESSCGSSSSTVGAGGGGGGGQAAAASDTSSIISGSKASAAAASASTWKQSQNLNFPSKIMGTQQQQQQQQQQQNSPSHSSSGRQRPNSPFPLLGTKFSSSGQTFTVGMGKNTKTTPSSTNFNKDKTYSSSSSTHSHNSKNANKSPGGGGGVGSVVFSVAAPNISRKSHRN